MYIGMIIFGEEDAHRYVYILEGGYTYGMEGGCTLWKEDAGRRKEDTHRYTCLYSGRGMHIGMIIFWKEDAHRHDYILGGGAHRYVYILEGGYTYV